MTHPVTRSRQPFGMFLDIMDYKCVAIDGKPLSENSTPVYLRIDSHGRIFVKTEDTNGLWEKVAEGTAIADLLKETGSR